MMSNIWTGTLVYLAGEVLAFLLFPIVRTIVASEQLLKKPDIETFKGILERLVLFVGLMAGHSTVLVMFGTLKLGTRLKDDNVDKISNNYFLVGNMLSVLIAIGDATVYQLLLQ